MADIDPREANLTTLRRLTSDLLEEASDVPALKDEPVNWAGVACISAERYEDEDGFWGLRVWLDDCSPDAHGLFAWLRKRLESHGCKVNVLGEW